MRRGRVWLRSGWAEDREDEEETRGAGRTTVAGSLTSLLSVYK